MRIHLENSSNRTELNLDFTRFFSERRQRWTDYNGKKGSAPLDHRAMMRNLVETFIGPDEMNLYEMEPVGIVAMWFENALKEKMPDENHAVLEENYRVFRNMYHLDGNPDPVIRKMNGVRGKGLLWRIVLGDCAFIVNRTFMLAYEGPTEGLVEELHGSTREDVAKGTLRVYEPRIDGSVFLYMVTYRNLKLALAASSGKILKVGEHFYQIGQVFPYLKKDEDIEVWQDCGALLLRQSDRDILMYGETKASPDDEAVGLEGFRVGCIV